MPPRRLRLDAELVRRGLARSREHASELIAAGRVTVNKARAAKPATGVTTDADIVAGKPFAGQYTIDSYDFNNLIQYKANPDYQGVLGPAKTGTVNVKYYADQSNLKLDVAGNAIDVAFRTLSATDIADLRTNDKVKVVDGPGGEIRYIVFNFNTMPYGAKTDDADPKKALAVRQAMAHLTVQAHADGLHVHQMAGFDPEAVRKSFGVPEDFVPKTVAVIGRLAPAELLDSPYRERESAPRERRGIAGTVFGTTWDASYLG